MNFVLEKIIKKFHFYYIYNFIVEENSIFCQGIPNYLLPNHIN